MDKLQEQVIQVQQITPLAETILAQLIKVILILEKQEMSLVTKLAIRLMKILMTSQMMNLMVRMIENLIFQKTRLRLRMRAS